MDLIWIEIQSARSNQPLQAFMYKHMQIHQRPLEYTVQAAVFIQPLRFRLLSISEMSRTSGWTCWDTRGRSSVLPSSSEPIWRRGRWRCEILLQHNPSHGFLWCSHFCLLCLVSLVFFFFDGAHFKPKDKTRISFYSRRSIEAPLCIFFYTADTTTRWGEKEDRTSCQSLTTNKRSDAPWEPQSRSKRGAEEKEDFKESSMFSTRFYLLLAFQTPHPSAILPLTVSSTTFPPFSISPALVEWKHFFVSIQRIAWRQSKPFSNILGFFVKITSSPLKS